MRETNIHVYISCTESFKRRLKHGIWIDTSHALEEIKRMIAAMIATSIFAENTSWRITEFNTPVPYDFLHDQTSLEDLHNMAMLIEYHGDVAAKLLQRFNGDVVEAEDFINERYLGHFESETAFTKQKLKEEGYHFENLKRHFDYNAIWRLWSIVQYFSLPAKDGGVYVFKWSIKERAPFIMP